jgi:ERCC4-related helicase
VSTAVQALDELVAFADAAERQDPKLQQLAMEIADIRRRYPRAKIITYTEYTDSQQSVVQALREAEVDPILTMCGDDPDNIRLQITDRFRTQDGLVLVSSDAAAEGLNLHERCHHLIQPELPFNPNRLDQRNGCIDNSTTQSSTICSCGAPSRSTSSCGSSPSTSVSGRD